MVSPELMPPKFNNTAILLHWIVAFLLVVQFAIGLDMVNIPKGPDSPRAFWFNTHKSIGIVIGMFVVFRLYWRVRSGIPKSIGTSSSWEPIAASISHGLLYVCMIVMPLSGILGSLFSKYDLVFFGLGVPKIFEPDELLKQLMTTIHQSVAYFFLALICLHILAAVKHLVINCDGVFEKMMPNFNGTTDKKNDRK